jgi:Glycosyltransferase family 87
VIYVRGYFWAQEFPLNSFLPAPATRFGDFFGNHDHWRRLQFSDISFQAAYFPFSYQLIDIFTSYLSQAYHSLYLFLGTFLALFLALIWALARKHEAPPIVAFAVMSLIAFSYPVIFTIQTGNIEAWTILFIFSSVVCKERGETTKSVIFLALATSMKVMPIVFLPYVLHGLLRQEKFRRFILFVTTGLLATLIALLTLPGGLTSGFGVIKRISQSQDLYKALMVTGEPGTFFGHSFLNGVYALFGHDVLRSETFWPIVTMLAFLLTGILILCSESFQPWGLPLLCASIGCLFAPTSTDYKLLYFLPGIALALFIQKPLGPAGYTVLILAVFIISPKPYGVLGQNAYFNAGVYLTPIAMIVMSSILSLKAAGWGREDGEGK